MLKMKKKTILEENEMFDDEYFSCKISKRKEDN